MSTTLRLQRLQDLMRGLAGPGGAARLGGPDEGADEPCLAVHAGCGRRARVRCERRAEFGDSWMYVLAEGPSDPVPIATVDNVARAVMTIRGFLGAPPPQTREPVADETRRRSAAGLVRLFA